MGARYHGRTSIENLLPRHVEAIVAQVEMLTPREQQQLSRLCKKLGSAWRKSRTMHFH
jgi:hypothetical protein